MFCPLCPVFDVLHVQHFKKALVFHVALPKDDDEWDDYRENKKDYTGLKIENLSQEQPKEEEEEETEVIQSKMKSRHRINWKSINR